MEKQTTELLANLYLELQEITMDSDNNLQLFERSYYIAVNKMQQLKDFIQGYTFKDKTEEIKFFKEIKPLFHKEVIYFDELRYMEANKPIATDKIQKHYYQKVIDRLMDYFERNRELYNYHRTNKTNQDEVYFVRGETSVHMGQFYMLDMDKNFSTPYSLNLAHLQAYEQLCSYLNSTLYSQELPVENAVDGKKKRRITWSGSKAALIELIIGLYFSGSVNFGKGGIKNVVNAFQDFFNIQLGNFYRVFLGMVIRKKEPTPFIHLLDETVKRKIAEKVM